MSDGEREVRDRFSDKEEDMKCNTYKKDSGESVHMKQL